MIIKLAETIDDLEQILTLQAENHLDDPAIDRRNADGFVTVKHTLDLLQKMNERSPQVIAVDNGKVVGYALVMLKEFSQMIPVLTPMFNMFDSISFNGRKICDHNYYVMGQICIKDSYRGKGIFKKLYDKHKEIYASKFEACLTEVSTSNSRSMKAHENVGFQVIHTFEDKTDEWNIVLWNWK